MRRLLLCLTAVLHLSTFGSMEHCQGDTQCHLCTVTGPTVIDIQGQADSVQDRCAYSLMESQTNPGFQVQASFQERRRKDVSFVNRVILSVDDSGVHIYLEQGGEVKLNNTMLKLNATAQMVHGVELSKDESGVTAKTSYLNYTMTVFFDGYTAQMHIEGPSGQSPTVEGLCGNSSSFNESKLSDISAIGCETQYEDSADSTISCNTTTERCNLLKEAPFTACHSNIDPEPYVTACTNTLCKYPAGDGLNCQFFEAYARACSLYSANAIDSWRSKVNCSAEPQTFCQDRFCSSHEFCGENSLGDGTRCHCRAIFASKYRSENTFGDAVVCSGTYRVSSLFGCLLEDKDISYSDLHLFDSNCRGVMDNVNHVVTFAFDSKNISCGTLLRMNSKSEVINKNSIILDTTYELIADMSCPFTFPEITIDFSVNIKIKSGYSSSSTVAYVTSGIWKYTLVMSAYTDAGRTQAVSPSTELYLNQKVWFELKADGLDDKVVALVTNNCFATNEPSPSSNLKYDLITNGCSNPADPSVVIESNGEGTSNYFSFDMFQFSGESGDVYLHCKMNLCIKENNSCIPSCAPNVRRRRSSTTKYKDESPAIAIMAWST